MDVDRRRRRQVSHRWITASLGRDQRHLQAGTEHDKALESTVGAVDVGQGLRHTMRPENLDLLGCTRRGRVGRLGQELVVDLAPIGTHSFGSCDRAYAAELIGTEPGDGAANGDLLGLRWLPEHQETDDQQPDIKEAVGHGLLQLNVVTQPASAFGVPHPS